MGIISWIFLGLVAGALAKFIMPGKDPGGIFVTILIEVSAENKGRWQRRENLITFYKIAFAVIQIESVLIKW